MDGKSFYLKHFWGYTRKNCLDKKTISDVMREMGRKGGKVGGKRSLETMTPEERQERARKASGKAAEARAKKAAKNSAVEKISLIKRAGERTPKTSK